MNSEKEMQIKLVYSVVFLGLFLLVAVLTATQVDASALIKKRCQQNDHIRIDRSNYLVISEFAVTESRYDCPTYSYNLDKPIRSWSGRKIYFWFRLQGDQGYLNLGSSNKEIVMHVSRILSGGNLLRDRKIGLGRITPSIAQQEASFSGGVFDWRVNGWRGSLLVPGKYILWLEQGGRRICPLVVQSKRCVIKFTVSK